MYLEVREAVRETRSAVMQARAGEAARRQARAEAGPVRQQSSAGDVVRTICEATVAAQTEYVRV